MESNGQLGAAASTPYQHEKGQTPMSNATPLKSTEFENQVLKSDIPVLIDFWAVWCGPCKMIAPHIDAIAAEYEGKVKVMKVNIDEERDIADRYNIMSIPTLLFFKGGKVVEQVVGAMPKAAIVSKLETIL
jgi:thioredoxin 1